MKNKLTLLTNWIAYIVICLIMYFWENIVTLDFTNPNRGFNTNEIIALFLGLILLTAVYFIIEKKNNNLKFDWVLIIVLSLLFITSMITALLTPAYREFVVYGNGIIVGEITEPTWYHGFFTVTGRDRLFSIFFAFLNFLGIYFCLAVFPRKVRFKKLIDVAFWIGLTFTAVLLIYSYIAEFHSYINFIVTFFDHGVTYDHVVMSFLNNKNSFGFMLFFMIAITYYTHTNHPKWWWLYILAGFFFVSMLPSLSKTNIGAGLILIIGYPLGRFFLTLKEHRKRNVRALIISLSVIVGILLVLLGVLIFNDHFRENSIQSFKLLFLTEEGQYISSTVKRFWLWGHTIDILNHTSWVVGTGFGIFQNLLLSYTYTDISLPTEITHLAHNYFMQALGEGGIIYLSFVIFVMVIFIINLVKITKRHKMFAFFEWILLGSLIPHMLMESVGPLGHGIPSINTFMIYLLLYAPVFSVVYHEKHPEDNAEFLKECNRRGKTRIAYFSYPYAVSDLIYMIYTPLLAILIGPVWMYFKNDALPFVIAGLVLFFIGPYLVHVLEHAWRKKTRKFLNPWKYILKVILPFMVGLITMFTFNRIFLTIMGVTYSLAWFSGASSLFLYAMLFIFIPSFKERASFIRTLDYNYTSKVMRLYRPFVKEVVEQNKENALNG